MKAQPTIAGLLTFINAQPDDRPINHTTWNSCAVGDYAREVLSHEIAVPFQTGVCDYERDYSPVWRDPVMVALWKEAGTKDSGWLAECGVDAPQTEIDTLVDFLDGSSSIPTYGELKTEIYTRVKEGLIAMPA